MTLILQGTDNSVSSPAVQGGTAGATTGVYYPASNQVALATNGTLALSVNASQQVGIGLSTMTAKFVVAGSTPYGSGAQATYPGTIQINETGNFTLDAICGLEFKGSVFGAGYGVKIFGADNGNLLFGYRSNSASWTESMRITTDSKLLLNLTSNTGYTSNANPQAYINAGNTTASVLCGLTLINQGNGGTSGYGVSLRFNMSTGEPGKYCQIAATADGSFANSIGLAFYTTGNAAGGADNVTQRMYIGGGGSIGAPSGTNIYNASDERLKKNIQPLTGNLEKINSLEPVSFNWIENFCKEENDKVLYGFVAQRTQPVDGNLVEHFGATSNVTVDAGTDNEVVVESPLRVNEKFIIPMLVGAIQELKAEFDAYKATHP
jgi:hypothetical protein